MHIGSVKFATQIIESPCSPVVIFPSFGFEQHCAYPHRGTPTFCHYLLLQWIFIYFFVQCFFPFKPRALLLLCIPLAKTVKSMDRREFNVIFYFFCCFEKINNGLKRNPITDARSGIFFIAPWRDARGFYGKYRREMVRNFPSIPYILSLGFFVLRPGRRHNLFQWHADDIKQKINQKGPMEYETSFTMKSRY